MSKLVYLCLMEDQFWKIVQWNITCGKAGPPLPWQKENWGLATNPKQGNWLECTGKFCQPVHVVSWYCTKCSTAWEVAPGQCGWNTLCVEEFQCWWCYFDKLQADIEKNDEDEIGEVENWEKWRWWRGGWWRLMMMTRPVHFPLLWISSQLLSRY